MDPGRFASYNIPLHLRLPADSAAEDATATSGDSLLDDMANLPSPTPSQMAEAAPESPRSEAAPESPRSEAGEPAIAQEAASSAPSLPSSPEPSLPDSEAGDSAADAQALMFIIYL